MHVVDCNATACNLTIPDEGLAQTYLLRSVDVAPSGHDRAAAHLLMQTTFGPTRAAIANLSAAMTAAGSSSADAAEQYVLEQLAMPASLHRAYLRRRANPRLDTVTEVGRPRGACEDGARWSRVAIRADDAGGIVRFETIVLGDGSNLTALYINEVLRSEVDLTLMRPWGLAAPPSYCMRGALSLATNYSICRVEEWPLGVVVIGSSCDGKLYPGARDAVEVYNTLMRFENLSYPSIDDRGEPIELYNLTDTSAATLQPLPATIYSEGVLHVARMHISPCPFSVAAQLRPSTTLLHEGMHYRYDPRLVMIDNTLEAPAANLSGASASIADNDNNGHVCPLLLPSAPKTFLNEQTCAISHGCRPDDYLGGSFVLNHSTIRAFFTEGANFVYALDALPLDTSIDPCGNRATRWVARPGACVGGETPVDAATASVLVTALNGQDGANMAVKDITLDATAQAACVTGSGGSSAIGAKLEVNGSCWEHSHPNQLDVYDFTLWANDHDGNVAAGGFFPIKAFAHDGHSVLHFPASHPISRFQTAWSLGPRVGRLGDALTFDALPRTVQTAGVARALGLSVTPRAGVAGVETCGSPGEVASDPSLGNVYYWGKQRYKQVAPYALQEVLSPYRLRDNGIMKQMVHTMLALHAPDQLRQRVAWALAQWLVVAQFDASVLGDHSEVRAPRAPHSGMPPPCAPFTVVCLLPPLPLRRCGRATTTSSRATPSAPTAPSCARSRSTQSWGASSPTRAPSRSHTRRRAPTRTLRARSCSSSRLASGGSIPTARGSSTVGPAARPSPRTPTSTS